VIFRRASLALLYAVLVLAPLLFGSRSLWPFATIELFTAAGVAAWFLAMIVERRLEWRRTSLDLPVGLLIGIVALQMLVGNRPLARWALAPPGPESVPPRLPVPFLTLGSVSPVRTMESLILLMTCAGAYVIVVNVIRHRRQLQRLVHTLLWLGSGLAVFGLFDSIGRKFRLGWRDEMMGRVVATFLNADHFAAWLNMLICLGIGYLLARHGATRGQSNVIELLRSADGRERLIRQYFPLFAVIPMLLAVIFTLSRGAVSSLILTLGVMLILAGAIGTARRSGLVIGGLITVAVACAGWIGLGPLLTGIKRGPADFQLRWLLAVTSLPMLKDFPVLGVGLGAYKDAYFRYRTAAIPDGFFVDYAHNDVLQLILEVGLFGAAITAYGIWRASRDIVGTHLLGRGSCPVGGGDDQWARRNDPFSIGITIGALGGALSLGIHSLFDFPARLPANGLLAAVCLGIASLAIHTRFHSEAKPLSATRSLPLRGHVATIAAAAIAVLLCAVFVEEAIKPVLADAKVQAAERLPGATPAPFGMAPEVQILTVQGRQRLTAASKLWQTGVAMDGRLVSMLEARRQDATALLTAATNDLRRAIALEPSNPYLHESLGWTYATAAAIESADAPALEAAAHFLRAIALAPNDAALYRSLLAFIGRQPDRDVSLALWASRTATERDPRLLSDLVYELLALPLTDAQWVAAVPDTAIDRISLGVELERRNLTREARYLYTQAIVVAGPAESPFARWLLASLMLRTGDSQPALAEIERALRSAPDNPELHRTHGDALAATGDAEALDAYRLAVLKTEALVRRHPRGFNLFAISAPRTAAILSVRLGPPDRPVARYRRVLAAYLTDRKMWDSALAEWDTLIAATPEDPAAFFGRGTVYDALGRTESALVDYRRAVALDGANVSHRLRLAQRLWDTDQYFQAIEQWRTALASEPDNLEAHVSLARANVKIGEKAAALQEYERVVKLAPDHAEARRMVTQMLREVGRIP
jgi:tetratricopeptide (TPR) repeat protein/O-antigen ligase